jgi:hypothetical protein
MAYMEINPAYRDFLESQGLTEAAQMTALPGVVVCGHPERHVMQVTLPFPDSCWADESMRCFLKRQHRVSWRQRLANAWAGFGLVSSSRREARLLRALPRAGVGCPEWLAAGEDNQGRAFLLVRALNDAVDLPTFLRDQQDAAPRWRRRFFRHLGENLARLHDAGFEHRDLYAKHVLIDPSDASLYFLDWQRGRQRAFLDWPHRWHDLAALHATLTDDLASPRDRLACLRAYLRSILAIRTPRRFRQQCVRQIGRQAERLLRRRPVREQRQTAAVIGAQQLIWLDGEGLCVTPEFHAALHDRERFQELIREEMPVAGLSRQPLNVPGLGQTTLIRRWSHTSWRWLWAWLGGRRWLSPEVRQAGLLFRLQRYGIGAPQLLAFGQRQRRPWRGESFLLTAPPRETVGLADWLEQHSHPWTAEFKQRQLLLRDAARLMRRLHEAGCQLGGAADAVERLQVRQHPKLPAAVVLGSIDGLVLNRRTTPAQALRDLAVLDDSPAALLCSHTELLRFLLTYLGQKKLTPQVRELIAQLMALRTERSLRRQVQQDRFLSMPFRIAGWPWRSRPVAVPAVALPERRAAG